MTEQRVAACTALLDRHGAWGGIARMKPRARASFINAQARLRRQWGIGQDELLEIFQIARERRAQQSLRQAGDAVIADTGVR